MESNAQGCSGGATQKDDLKLQFIVGMLSATSKVRGFCHGVRWSDSKERACLGWQLCLTKAVGRQNSRLNQSPAVQSAWLKSARGSKCSSRPLSWQKRAVLARGFFSQLFGGKSTGVELDEPQETEPISELDTLEEGGELILTETVREDGSVASIVYRNGGYVDAAQVDVLCAKVKWPRRQIHKVAACLRNSFLVSHIHLRIAYPDGRGQEEKLIGMARATSDHAFNATIWDVIVDPEYQRRGLGKCLVEQIIRALLRRDITNISLFAEPNSILFYKKMGFEADPSGIKGMFWNPPTS